MKLEFKVDKAASKITVRREFAAPRPLVWDCYSKRELLDQWYAPKPLTTRTKHMDFREGGHWHFAMVAPDGQTFWNRLDYQRIQALEGYTGLDGFSDETGAVNPAMPRSTMVVSFADAGAETVVTTVVTYASADDVQKVIDMGLEQGLTSTLERLDELLPTLQ